MNSADRQPEEDRDDRRASEQWLDLVAELLAVARERGDVEYFELVKGDLQVRFGRGTAFTRWGRAASDPEVTSAPDEGEHGAGGSAKQMEALATSVLDPLAPSPSASEAPATFEEREGTVLVRSPMVGIFYRAPAPGEPPFVEVGSAVAPDTTMGLVEAMKVFTGVRPNVAGVVEEIFAADTAFIEFDQPLFRVSVS